MNGSLAARDSGDHFPQLLHCIRAAYQPRSADVRRGVVHLATIAELDGAADEFAQDAEIQWLGDEVERSQLQSTDRGLNIAMCRDDGNRHGGAVFLDPGY